MTGVGSKSEACEHGPERQWCATCLLGPEVQGIAAPIGPEFVATVEGVCDGCEGPILVGQKIQRWDDDSYRHRGGRCNP